MNIQNDLKRFARRVRLLRAWYGFAIGGSSGAALSAIWAALDFFNVLYTSWLWMGILISCCALLGAVIGSLLRIHPHALATSVDRRALLKDRVGTALSRHNATSFDDAQRADAAAHLKSVRAAAVYPLRFTKWHASLLAGALLASCVFLLGNTPLLQSKEKQAERKAVQEKGKEVEKIARPLAEEKPERVTESDRELLKKLQDFQRELDKGRITKQEMLQKADELAKKADELSKKQYDKTEQSLASAQEALRQMEDQALERAGMEKPDHALMRLSQQELQAKANGLQQKMQSLEQQLSSGKDSEGNQLTSDQKRALEQQLKALKDELAKIRLSQKARDFLNKLFSRPEWKEIQELMKQLQQAAKDAQANQQKLTPEQMKEMVKKLEELAEKLKDEKALKEFLEKLKEALKNAKSGDKLCDACCLLGLGMGLGNGGGMSMGSVAGMNGAGGPSDDKYFSGLGHVPQRDKPDAIKGTSEVHSVTGQRREEGAESYIEVRGPTALGDRSRVPYSNVLPKYERKAEQALQRQQIPKEHAQRVKQYFQSLQGGGK